MQRRREARRLAPQARADRPLRREHRLAVVEGHLRLLAPVPGDGDVVRGVRIEMVDHGEAAQGGVVAQLAPVRHRVVEAAIAVVLADEALRRRLRHVRDEPRARLPEPHEVAAGDRLVFAVDAHGVVRQGAAEVVAPGLVRVIGVGAGVDQQLAPAGRQGEGERVGMAVRRDRQIAERRAVDGDAHLARRVEVRRRAGNGRPRRRRAAAPRAGPAARPTWLARRRRTASASCRRARRPCA